jgi:NPCBM/NEW2 domain
LGDLSPTRLAFQWDGQEMLIKRSKIAAMAYYHAKLPKHADLVCRLETADGGRLHVASLKLEGDMLQVVTCCGLTLDLPLDTLVHVDYSPGKLAYLSDLEPIGCEWTPRVDLPQGLRWISAHGWPRTDKPFASDSGKSEKLQLLWPAPPGPLHPGPAADSSDGPFIRSYAKGLALRSRTEIVYRLPREMRRFHAIAGIAPATVSQGNVDLTLYCDSSQRWHGVIDGDQPPVKIELNIEGVRELKIIVDYGENLDWGDQLHLVEARVTK